MARRSPADAHYGAWQGIPRSQVQGVLERGQDVVLRLDVQGAATIRRLIPDCISIFIVRPRPATQPVTFPHRRA